VVDLSNSRGLCLLPVYNPMVNGGGPLNRCAPVLSPEGKYILVAAASSVRLYSSVTASIVHSLNGHTQEVTAVVLDNDSKEQVHDKFICCPVAASTSCTAVQERKLTGNWIALSVSFVTTAGVHCFLRWHCKALELCIWAAVELYECW